MKRTYTAFLLFISLTLGSCNLKDKINDATSFEFKEETSFTIPSSTVVDIPLDIATPEIQSSGKEAFENNNTSADLVERIRLSTLDLLITQPSDRTFSFLKSIKIYISTDDKEEILLAEKLDISENIGQELPLETTGENLKPLVSGDTYNLRYEVVTRETTNSQTDITASMVFTVNAVVL